MQPDLRTDNIDYVKVRDLGLGSVLWPVVATWPLVYTPQATAHYNPLPYIKATCINQPACVITLWLGKHSKRQNSQFSWPFEQSTTNHYLITLHRVKGFFTTEPNLMPNIAIALVLMVSCPPHWLLLSFAKQTFLVLLNLCYMYL